MPRTFPERFDPYDWQGPRARAHRQREDAFQQLVGHAGQEIHGLRAHVAATAGRDGSIDIYIDDDPGGVQTFQGWPLPLILECKDHDESGRDLAKNIQAGWSTVRERLNRQAEAGWPGDYAPWRRARTYLYCVSSRLPNQAARDNLQKEILEFFDGLPMEKRPPFEAMAVLDWSDLRTWLDGLPRVADAWLGTEIPSIVGHEQFLEALAGFRRYLLPEELPYVAPEAGSATHPDRLFERLAKDDANGVLIVGVGGVGKTRLAVEVASRAAAAGWHVLHAGVGDSSLEVDALAAAALGQGSRALVVLDYLEQMHRLDPGAVRHRLLPEARRRGQSIVLLATARPGAAVLDHPGWGSLLETVTLTLAEDQVEAIAEQMRVALAPRAAAILGKERLRQLCGRRPILTLFLARELERRAVEGLLGGDWVADLREGDLLHWLRLRLEENRILVPAAHRLVPPDPEDEVVAAAAVLAAAPLLYEDLIATAEIAFGERAELAQPLVNNLAAFGWLEPSPWEWSTAHDVVADEVLEQVLRLRPGTGVRSRVLHVLLAAGLRLPRILGRFALALRRLILASADEPAFAESLTRAAHEWLQSNEAELASILAAADSDETSYALGSVVAGPPWDELAFSRWDTLIGPWLDRWKETREARHLLYIGLSRKEHVSARLEKAALAWLRIHSRDLEASFILHPLLERNEASSEAVIFGLAWLSWFPEEKEARFVLPRPDLGEKSSEAIDRGLFWLSRFPEEKEACFVLDPLLGRPDLGARSGEAIDRGLSWLLRFPEEKEARFVLNPLLGRPDLGERSSEAIDRGLFWLSRYPEEKEAGFVLDPLLGRSDPSQKKTGKAIECGLSWLSRFPLEKEAGFVLAPLLGRLGRDHVAQGPKDAILAFTFDWLNRHYETRNAEFIFKNLFRHKLGGGVLDRYVGLALQRAETLPLESSESSFLLRTVLLAKGLTDAQKAHAVQLSLAWCELHSDSPSADFLLKPLLRRKGLSDDDWSRAVRLALDWLRNTPHTSDRDFLLQSCLTRPHLLSDGDVSFLKVDILAWSQAYPEARETSEKLRRVLRRIELRRVGDVESLQSRPSVTPDELFQWFRLLSAGPAADILEAGIVEARSRLFAGRAGSARYYLAPLLPLTVRWGTEAQAAEVRELTRSLLDHPGLSETQRGGFVKGSLALLEGGAWAASVEMGRQVLCELGVSEEALDS